MFPHSCGVRSVFPTTGAFYKNNSVIFFLFKEGPNRSALLRGSRVGEEVRRAENIVATSLQEKTRKHRFWA